MTAQKLSQKERIDFFHQQLKRTILILDGGMGTTIQSLQLSAQKFGGEAYDGCNEILNVQHPEIIKDIHRSFLEAGSDIIETNSFGSSPVVLAEYGLEKRSYEISHAAARIARETAAEYDSKDKPRFVAASIGPTTKSISLTGGITFDEMIENFYTQMRGLWDGGADIIYMETAQDTLNLKAGGLALERLRRETGVEIPVMISGTIEAMGTMLAGQNIESLAVSIAHLNPISVGLNCATGPEYMTDHVRSLAKITPFNVSVMPNAGLPDEDGHYHESPEQMASTLADFAQEGWVNIVGGCCGTTPEHIRHMAKISRKYSPRTAEVPQKSYLSNIDLAVLEEENRPYLIAERTNVIGSRKFKEMIINGEYDAGADLARKQVKAGAAIIDVCLSNPDRDELTDMEAFLPVLLRKVKAPIMIDSTDERVIEAALKEIQGKALINSVNLENGEERFEEIVPLARHYGAALVVGTIDDDPEQGMGVTVERKLEIAERSYNLLVNRFQFPPEDIYFDPLVFPVGTGDEAYIGSAEATIEGVRRIKQAFPKCKTTLGISNVSFGLPANGREVLNSVFLYHNVQAGLDTAIVNTQKLKRYPSIPEQEKQLAERLLFHKPELYHETLHAFAAHFKVKKEQPGEQEPKKKNLSAHETIANCIVEATREDLVESLETLYNNRGIAPIDIINGPLMDGMREVGRLFNDNHLIVAEVLQSAEVMKNAVNHLQQYMESSGYQNKGTMVLATVKGDVHDIGKNLVDIVLSNNGYKIINLGIKIPPEKLIEAIREHQPDFIGLSGLLVKSAQQMVITAQDLTRENIDLPMILGGAALSANFVSKKVATSYSGVSIYAKDAMQGLDIVNRLADPNTKEQLLSQWRLDSAASQDNKANKQKQSDSDRKKWLLDYRYGPKRPVDLKKHILPGEGVDKQTLLETAFLYVNPSMLYKKHLGYRGKIEQAQAENEKKFFKLKQVVEECQQLMLDHQDMGGRAVYRFFPAYSEGDEVALLSPDRSRELRRIHYPRQSQGWQLSAADFVAPKDSGLEDYIALFVTSSGFGVRAEAERLKEKGAYLKSHTLQALALETAEAMAEWLHERLRRMWGWPDPSSTTMKDLFGTNYQGIRLSFGYPACPDLDSQAIIWDLLEVEQSIGVLLTDEFMMEPEASVSAVVFQHPEGRYFAVKEES